MNPTDLELKPEQLRRVVDPNLLRFQSTAELATLTEMIGQDRARASLQFGLAVPGPGYNTFALGQVGTGRWAMVKRLVNEKAAKEPPPQDWVYVNNFVNPSAPIALNLPAGTGCELRKDMAELVSNLQREIPRAFESEEYERQKTRISQELQEKQGQILKEMQRQAEEKGFGLAQTPVGMMLVPMERGKPLSEAEFESLPEQAKEKTEQAETALQQQLTSTLRRARLTQKEAQDALEELDRNVAAFATGHLLDELEAKYRNLPQVLEYLENVRKDVIDNVELFRPEAEQAGPLGQMMASARESALNRYKVNLLVDASCQQRGAPVIIETNPTYYNLIGEVEQEAQFGALVTDFTKIKAGAFHKANGGYLILEARSVLMNPFAYDALKRVLKDGKIEIEEMGAQYRLFNTTTLDPQPIPAQVKVVLIGEPEIYYLLYELDEDFRTLFKVKADFGNEVDRDSQMMDEYALFVATTVREQGLRPFAPDAVAKIIEYGSRLVEDQKKLATRFAEVADMITEASYWASQAGHELVVADDVKRAIDHKIYRSNRIQERIQEMIQRGIIMVDTRGAVVGQVNALSVASLGDYEFGRPNRITARTYIGKGNVVNIDREVEMAGPIHNKGVLILSGYLGGRYAHDLPLSLSASITFEQSYEGIEGDSASSAELYALLSSLAEVPVRQSLAVTGSVNQRGEVQPIGGANAKVEGYFDVCRALGLTGDQGVMLPAANVESLMLREDVVEAVREGKFHIYAVKTIDEGIEILTGIPAGQMENGKYPEGSINARVQQRLFEMARVAQKFGAEEEEEQPEREREVAGVRMEKL